MAARLAGPPRPKAVPCPLRPDRRLRPPALSAAANAWAINGRARGARRERMRPSRTLRSSSPLMAKISQGAHSAELSITCANRHVALRKCTLRQVADLRALSFHPTARTLRLLSCSRSVGSLLRPASHPNMRKPANHCETRSNESSRPPSSELRTNRRSAGGVVVVGTAAARPSERISTADRPWFVASVDVGSARVIGNNALDHASW